MSPVSLDDLRQLKADLLRAEIRNTLALAEYNELDAQIRDIQLGSQQEDELERLASNRQHGTYYFLATVSHGACMNAILELTEWSRMDELEGKPPRPITFIINSPGGSVIEGFALYDFLQQLRRKGHHLTTKAIGMAASMGGILLMAGNDRVADKRAKILIHEISTGMIGKLSEIEDEIAFAKTLADDALEILAERANLSKTQIAKRWSRKDWWLSADDALKLGFVDRVE